MLYINIFQHSQQVSFLLNDGQKTFAQFTERPSCRQWRKSSYSHINFVPLPVIAEVIVAGSNGVPNPSWGVIVKSFAFEKLIYRYHNSMYILLYHYIYIFFVRKKTCINNVEVFLYWSSSQGRKQENNE